MLQLDVAQQTFFVSEKILSRYLPGLGSRMWHEEVLNLPSMYGMSDKPSEKAFKFLMEYLQELSQDGYSGALLQNLESHFEAHRHAGNSHHRLDGNPTTAIFERLGYIIGRASSQCHPDIYRALSAFFIRHCHSILQRDFGDAVTYLAILERLDGSTEAIACVSHYADEIVEAAREQQMMGKLSISSRTKHLLYKLGQQNQERRVSTINGRQGLMRRNGGMATRLGHDRDAIQSWNSRQGIVQSGRGFNGREILRIWQNNPSNILVRDTGRRRPRPDLCSGDDCNSICDSDDSCDSFDMPALRGHCGSCPICS